MHFSISKLAQMFKKDRATVAERVQTLTPTDGPKNSKLYDVREAWPLILELGPDAKDQGQRLRDEQLREMTERADKLALQNAKLRGEVVAIEDVAAVVEGEYGAVKAALLALPSKCSSDLAVMESSIEIRTLLERLINEALSELSGQDNFEIAADAALDNEDEI